MPARDRPKNGRAWTPEKVRERIRTALIARRLTEHVLGDVKMSASQVTAALGLLRKTLPDLTATEISGELRQRDVSDQPLSPDEWAERYSLASTSGPTESAH